MDTPPLALEAQKLDWKLRRLLTCPSMYRQPGTIGTTRSLRLERQARRRAARKSKPKRDTGWFGIFLFIAIGSVVTAVAIPGFPALIGAISQ